MEKIVEKIAKFLFPQPSCHFNYNSVQMLRGYRFVTLLTMALWAITLSLFPETWMVPPKAPFGLSRWWWDLGGIPFITFVVYRVSWQNDEILKFFIFLHCCFLMIGTLALGLLPTILGLLAMMLVLVGFVRGISKGYDFFVKSSRMRWFRNLLRGRPWGAEE